MNCPKCYVVTTIEDDDHRCPECGFTFPAMFIHPVRQDDESIEYHLFFDGEHLNVGELWQLFQLHEKFGEVIEQGVHDGFLDADDERIATWLTVREAAELSGLSKRAIQWACKNGRIEGARPGPWRFTLQAFRRWRHSQPVKRRAHRAKSNDS